MNCDPPYAKTLSDRHKQSEEENETLDTYLHWSKTKMEDPVHNFSGKEKMHFILWLASFTIINRR